MPAAIGLRHPASASCLGRHSRLAGRCPNNSSLFPPLAAVVVVALWASIAERVFFICSSETPAGVSELLFYGGKHTPPPYRDFAHNFAPFFGRCCPQKRFISLNFGAILNLAFLSVPAVPFGGIAGQINRQRRGYHEKTHREHDTGTQYGALHPSCIRICRCRGRVFFRSGGRNQQHYLQLRRRA